MKKQQPLGFTLIEVLIGATIITSSMVGVLYVFHRLSKVAEENIRLAKGMFLLEEGMEAVRIMRDNSWDNLGDLTIGTTYYFNFNGLAWGTSTTNTFVDSLYERKFVLSSVGRTAGGAILASGGTVDPETKKATVTVSWWSGVATSSRALSAYFTKLF